MSHLPVLSFDLSTDFYMKLSLSSVSQINSLQTLKPLAGVVNYPEKGINPLMVGTSQFFLFHPCQLDCSTVLKTLATRLLLASKSINITAFFLLNVNSASICQMSSHFLRSAYWLLKQVLLCTLQFKYILSILPQYKLAFKCLPCDHELIFFLLSS